METSKAHPFISLGRDPISEDKPTGVSVRYETLFEQLEAELSKQESLSAASVNWTEVVKLSSEILKSHSKDLLVGVYLCHGLVETEAYAGLNVGLTILNEMIDTHWEGMFPPVKRLRARKTAMQWLAEKTGRYVNDHAPKNSDFDAVLEAAKLIREIDGNLAEKMGNAAPGLSDLTRPLKQYKGSIQQQQKAEASAQAAPTTPAPAPTQATPAKPEATPAPAPSGSPQAVASPRATTPQATGSSPAAALPAAIQVASDADARKGLRQIQENLRKLASFLLQTKVTDPRPYRLSRMSVWLVIDQLPPHQDGVTQVNPPAAERRKQLDLMLSQGDHVQFIQAVEQSLARAPFWLDGHRMTAQALSLMGPGGDAGKKVVIEEVAGFLNRLPGINDLKFADGAAFADDQTQLWLSTEVLTVSGGGSAKSSASSGSGSETRPWMETLPEAKKMAAGGKMDEALALFDQGISKAPNSREQFCWRKALADFLIQTGKSEVAVQILEQLVKEAESFQVDRWEPEISTEVYGLLHEAYQKLPGKKESGTDLKTRIDQNYARLCWINPAVAITIKS